MPKQMEIQFLAENTKNILSDKESFGSSPENPSMFDQAGPAKMYKETNQPMMLKRTRVTTSRKVSIPKPGTDLFL